MCTEPVNILYRYIIIIKHTRFFFFFMPCTDSDPQQLGRPEEIRQPRNFAFGLRRHVPQDDTRNNR